MISCVVSVVCTMGYNGILNGTKKAVSLPFELDKHQAKKDLLFVVEDLFTEEQYYCCISSEK